MKFLTIGLLAMFALSAYSFEGVENEALEGSDRIEKILHEDFLGCTHSREECRHEAEHSGYHHVRIRRDHHACPDHHHPFACYGVQ